MERSKREINEQILDAVMKVAAEEAWREEADAMPSLEELNAMYPRSESLEKKVYALIDGEFKARKRKRVFNIFQRVAAVFAFLLVVCTIALFSVEASRNNILNFFVDLRSDHAAIDFGDTGINEIVVGEFSFGYMPDGFNLISSQTLEGMFFSIFEDEGGNTILIQRISDTIAMGVDLEYMNYSTIQINGKIASVYEATRDYGENVIKWVLGDSLVTISSTIEIDALIRIAQELNIS